MDKLSNPTERKPAGDQPDAAPAAPLPMDQRPTPKWAQQIVDGMRKLDPNKMPDTP